jgi:hypothetical protein
MAINWKILPAKRPLTNQNLGDIGIIYPTRQHAKSK